jgi:hypothetical protein
MSVVRQTPRLFPAEVAAAVPGVSPVTLASKAWRQRHRVPYHRIGRLVRYDLAELRRWAEQRKVYARAPHSKGAR